MASEEMSTNAVVAAAPTRGISFSFAKRSQGVVSGSRGRVESHGVGGGRDDVKEEADKDLVFSLEGGNINRYVHVHRSVKSCTYTQSLL